MSDDEIKVIAAATKALFDQRDLTMRAELAAMRASVEAMEGEVRDLRANVKALPVEMHASTMRMVATMGEKLGAELPAAVRDAAERHLARAMVKRALPTEGATA